MSTALLLVEQLEQLALHEHIDDAQTLLRMVGERESLLSELKALDLTTLSAQERVEFQERVSELIVRDQLLQELVATRQEETRQALENLRSGRRATNGYAQTLTDSDPPAPSARRFG